MPYIHLRQDGWGMARSADGEKNRQTDTETWSLYNLHTDTYVKTYKLTEIKEHFDTYILTLRTINLINMFPQKQRLMKQN